jgi:hypothetical protein
MPTLTLSICALKASRSKTRKSTYYYECLVVLVHSLVQGAFPYFPYRQQHRTHDLHAPVYQTSEPTPSPKRRQKGLVWEMRSLVRRPPTTLRPPRFLGAVSH